MSLYFMIKVSHTMHAKVSIVCANERQPDPSPSDEGSHLTRTRAPTIILSPIGSCVYVRPYSTDLRSAQCQLHDDGEACRATSIEHGTHLRQDDTAKQNRRQNSVNRWRCNRIGYRQCDS